MVCMIACVVCCGPRWVARFLLCPLRIQTEFLALFALQCSKANYAHCAAGMQRQVYSSIKVRRVIGDAMLFARPHNPDVTATRLRLQATIDMHTALRLADEDELIAARGLISDILEQV
jgi:hypothetical protein